ncbi:MAG: ankyrin repeat domain-containing protein [Nitrospirae bacterium]|nr:ankyrin repeat domain-containing protein [Nitrospirota bacterium]
MTRSGTARPLRRPRATAACLLALLLGGCAAMERPATAGRQHDWDVLRLKDLRAIGDLIESYKDKAGHYPLAGRDLGPLVFEVPIVPAAPGAEAAGGGPDTVALHPALLAAELGRVLEKGVVLPTDPQPPIGGAPNRYLYRVSDGDYTLTVRTHGPFPFARPEDGGWHRLTVTSRTGGDTGIAYMTLMDDDAFVLAAAAPLDDPAAAQTRRVPPLPEATPDDALLWAVAAGSLPGVHAALAAGAIPTPPCPENRACSPLVLAARIGTQNMVAALYGAGANLNAADGTGDTALLMAATHPDPRAAEAIQSFLMTRGADPNQANRWGWSPFASFAAKGQQPLMAMALEHGGDIDLAPPATGVEGVTHGDPPLVAAARYGQAGAVRWLLDHGADPAATGYDGRTARLAAQAAGFQAVARLLP